MLGGGWRVGGEWTERPRVQVPWMRKRLGGGAPDIAEWEGLSIQG